MTRGPQLRNPIANPRNSCFLTSSNYLFWKMVGGLACQALSYEEKHHHIGRRFEHIYIKFTILLSVRS